MAKKQEKYGIVKEIVMKDPALSQGAKALYALLSMFADSDRECFPSIISLAEFSSVSERTIERQLKLLYEKGYVVKNGRTFTIV